MMTEIMKKIQWRRMYNGRKPNRVAIQRLREQEEEIIFEDKLICLKRGAPMTVILTTHSLLLNSTCLKLEDILSLAGFSCKVVETNGPRHAQALVSSFNFDSCPDGIICVGGDGIVNEVLNGLHSREDEKSRAIAIGIIPAGSDNSLVWTVFGISDPVTAALAIIKGHFVRTDVVAIKGMNGSRMYLGHTTFYLGFMSDVLELSAKYQRFGPLRYLLAGLIRLFNLRYYECEVNYIPAVEKVRYVDSNSILCGMTKESTSKAIIEGCGIDKQGNWKSSKGLFLGIIICNHQCKTVQCLKSQKLAPSAKHNDGLLDLLLVHKIGLFRLLWFLILMQYGHHVSLPFVEYIKVCRARINSVEGNISCGIDGELLTIDTPAFISVSPHQIYLIGHTVD